MKPIIWYGKHPSGKEDTFIYFQKEYTSMKRLIALFLVFCLVLGMTAPVSAGYFDYKGVNVDDFTNALVDYCNHNEVRNMTKYTLCISNHASKTFGVRRSNDSLDFFIQGRG